MWQGIYGHDGVVKQFGLALTAGRLASTFLLVGPEGIGKRTFALRMAQALLCQNLPTSKLDPCGDCPSCALAVAGTHPDLLIVGKPADKSFIPVSLFIGDQEHRRREGLCHDIGLKPFLGGRRIALIDDADFLNQEGANCLLKTLEEPPPRSVLFLIGTSIGKQLPTIRSRAQIIRFAPLSTDTVAEILLARGLVAERQDAKRWAALSDGSLQQAIELSDSELQEFRRQWLRSLAQTPTDWLDLASSAGQFVEQAGREAPLRRKRLRHVIRFSVEFYRCEMRSACGASTTDEPDLRAAIDLAAQHGSADAVRTSAAIDRCLTALEHIDRNANLSTLLECWVDDLRQLTHGRFGAAVQA